MFNFLEKQKYPVVLLMFGVALVLMGYFQIGKIDDVYSISLHEQPVYPILFLGIVFSFLSIAIYLFDEVTFGWVGFRKIKKMRNGYSTVVGRSEVNVLFGQLEKLADERKESLVVLPANEFFDDACIQDTRSALGAYVNARFKNQADQINALVTTELKDCEKIPVEKEAGVTRDSYGVGTGVYLETPLGSDQPVLLLSVTTKRAGEGLKAEMSYIFKCVQKIQQVMADKRLSSVLLPVMGSGHGGLRTEVALFGLLLAICDRVMKSDRHDVSIFDVVVFQPSEKDQPSIAKPAVKRLLRISAGMFSE